MSESEYLFTTTSNEGGRYSPMTLPMYAGKFLADLERLFGPRDRSFTLLGIDICNTPDYLPRLWFPSSGVAPDAPNGRSRYIVIHLGPAVVSSLARARWQLAHECVHLLDPWNEKIDGRPTNWLEEGLAAWYQNNSVPEAESHEGSYAVAEDLVKPLMDVLPDAIKRIRQELRLRIGEITPDVLWDHCPGMREETLRKLCQPFSNQPEPAQPDAAIEETHKSPWLGTGE